MTSEKLAERYFALEQTVYGRIEKRCIAMASKNAKSNEERAKISQKIAKKAEDLL